MIFYNKFYLWKLYGKDSFFKSTEVYSVAIFTYLLWRVFTSV